MSTTHFPSAVPCGAWPSEPAAYRLPVTRARQALARGWLGLSLLALIVSGLFSVLLVAARTPGVNELLPGGAFFRTALVVHVDMSVLVWFVAVAGMLWNLDARRRGALGWPALVAATAGTAMMALAPFVAPGTPVMANYIPVIESRLFLAGLAVFGVAAAFLVTQALCSPPRLAGALDGAAALRFGLYAAAVSAAVALFAFALSLVLVPASLDGKAYWEVLFWGGGHALQFTWTLIMLVGWLWLAHACGARVSLSARVALLLFAIALAAVFVTPYAYLAHDVLSLEHRELHTLGMRVGGGLAILPIGLAVALALARQRRIAGDARPLRAALLASMVLFAAGGLMGIAIDGSNVKIPAHYHGCIVAVTLAMMGLVYQLLPRLGYGTPRGRLAVTQPFLYGFGQLMHIVGLVWSGGYGVQRKVAGTEQVLGSSGEVFGMGLMGLGGLIAIVGGLLFVVVVWRARQQSEAQ